MNSHQRRINRRKNRGLLVVRIDVQMRKFTKSLRKCIRVTEKASHAMQAFRVAMENGNDTI